MSNKTNEVFNQIETLSMPELLEFVRLIGALPETNEITASAACYAHARIAFFDLVRRTKAKAQSLASHRNRVKNADFCC